MNKQDKIREGIAAFLCNYSGGSSWWYLSINHMVYKQQEYLEEADEILGYLHSEGVVIKVDRELPQNPYVDSYQGNDPEAQSVNDAAEWSYEEAQKDMKKAGFEAVGPLIKEQHIIIEEVPETKEG